MDDCIKFGTVVKLRLSEVKVYTRNYNSYNEVSIYSKTKLTAKLMKHL